MDDVIVPTPRALEVSVELEGEGVFRWLEATGHASEWKTAAGTLWAASPGALTIDLRRGRIELHLAGSPSEARPSDLVRSAEALLAAVRDLPRADLLLGCDLQVRVRRR